MTQWLDLAWMLVVIALIAWLTGNALAMLLVHMVSPSALVAERRQLWLLVALPWLLPIIAVTTITVLALAKKMEWIEDHCLFHDPHHPHFCLTHLPQFPLGTLQSFAGVTVLSVLLLALLWQVASQIRQGYRTRVLYRLVGTGGVINEVDDERPLALTTGIRKPVVFLSSGLKQHLSKRQQRIVVAHEFAHIRHKDVASHMLYELLLSLHLSRKPLRYRWRMNTESLADRRVMRHFAPLDIAAVLLTLIRISVRNPGPVSIAGADPQLRIQRLLHPVPCSVFKRFTEWFLWAGIAMTGLLIALNHHAVETLVGWLITL